MSPRHSTVPVSPSGSATVPASPFSPRRSRSTRIVPSGWGIVASTHASGARSVVSKRQFGISPRAGPVRTRSPFTKSW